MRDADAIPDAPIYQARMEEMEDLSELLANASNLALRHGAVRIDPPEGWLHPPLRMSPQSRFFVRMQSLPEAPFTDPSIALSSSSSSHLTKQHRRSSAKTHKRPPKFQNSHVVVIDDNNDVNDGSINVPRIPNKSYYPIHAPRGLDDDTLVCNSSKLSTSPPEIVVISPSKPIEKHDKTKQPFKSSNSSTIEHKLSSDIVKQPSVPVKVAVVHQQPQSIKIDTTPETSKTIPQQPSKSSTAIEEKSKTQSSVSKLPSSSLAHTTTPQQKNSNPNADKRERKNENEHKHSVNPQSAIQHQREVFRGIGPASAPFRSVFQPTSRSARTSTKRVEQKKPIFQLGLRSVSYEKAKELAAGSSAKPVLKKSVSSENSCPSVVKNNAQPQLPGQGNQKQEQLKINKAHKAGVLSEGIVKKDLIGSSNKIATQTPDVKNSNNLDTLTKTKELDTQTHNGSKNLIKQHDQIHAMCPAAEQTSTPVTAGSENKSDAIEIPNHMSLPPNIPSANGKTIPVDTNIHEKTCSQTNKLNTNATTVPLAAATLEHQKDAGQSKSEVKNNFPSVNTPQPKMMEKGNPVSRPSDGEATDLKTTNVATPKRARTLANDVLQNEAPISKEGQILVISPTTPNLERVARNTSPAVLESNPVILKNAALTEVVHQLDISAAAEQDEGHRKLQTAEAKYDVIKPAKVATFHSTRPECPLNVKNEAKDASQARNDSVMVHDAEIDSHPKPVTRPSSSSPLEENIEKLEKPFNRIQAQSNSREEDRKETRICSADQLRPSTVNNSTQNVSSEVRNVGAPLQNSNIRDIGNKGSITASVVPTSQRRNLDQQDCSVVEKQVTAAEKSKGLVGETSQSVMKQSVRDQSLKNDQSIVALEEDQAGIQGNMSRVPVDVQMSSEPSLSKPLNVTGSQGLEKADDEVVRISSSPEKEDNVLETIVLSPDKTQLPKNSKTPDLEGRGRTTERIEKDANNAMSEQKKDERSGTHHSGKSKDPSSKEVMIVDLDDNSPIMRRKRKRPIRDEEPQVESDQKCEDSKHVKFAAASRSAAVSMQSKPAKRKKTNHVSYALDNQDRIGRLKHPIVFPDSPKPLSLWEYEKNAVLFQKRILSSMAKRRSEVTGDEKIRLSEKDIWNQDVDTLETEFWNAMTRGVNGKPITVAYGVDVESEGAFDSKEMSYVEWHESNVKDPSINKARGVGKDNSSEGLRSNKKKRARKASNNSTNSGTNDRTFKKPRLNNKFSVIGDNNMKAEMLEEEQTTQYMEQKKETMNGPKSHVGNLNRKGLLRHMPRMPGINHSMFYVGQLFTRFCWHTEDAFLNSVSYLHHGSAEKIWYAVPPSFATDFETYASKNVFASELVKQGTGQALLMNKTTIFDPREVRKRGIDVFRVVHKPGSFVLTAARAYHAGFNCGFNIAEAVNYASPQWFPVGREASHFARKIARPLCVPLEYLLYHEAKAIRDVNVSGVKTSKRCADYAAIIAKELEELLRTGEQKLREYTEKRNCRLMMLSSVDKLVSSNQLGPEFGHGAGIVCSICGHACHFYAEVCGSCPDSIEARCMQHFGRGPKLCPVSGHKSILVRRHDPVLLYDLLEVLEEVGGIEMDDKTKLERYRNFVRTWKTPIRRNGQRLIINLNEGLLRSEYAGNLSHRGRLRQARKGLIDTGFSQKYRRSSGKVDVAKRRKKSMNDK